MNHLSRWIAYTILCPFILQAAEVHLLDTRLLTPDQWSWGQARIQAQNETWLITERNRDGDYGDVYLEQHLPFIPQAYLELDMAGVNSGFYTLQVLAFEGRTHTHSAEPVKEASQPGQHRVQVKDLNFPSQTDAILFKIWVGGAQGASSTLNHLRYVLPLANDDILLDERFTEKAHWAASDLPVNATPEGARFFLPEDREFASALYTPAWPHTSAYLLAYVDVPEGATLTLQAAPLDHHHTYLGGLDVFRSTGPGWYGLDLSSLSWPDQTKYFQAKIWLAGRPGAKAHLRQLLLIRRAP